MTASRPDAWFPSAVEIDASGVFIALADCPHPSRVHHRSEGAAWAALRGHSGHQMIPYRCACGRGWCVALAAEARAKREARA